MRIRVHRGLVSAFRLEAITMFVLALGLVSACAPAAQPDHALQAGPHATPTVSFPEDASAYQRLVEDRGFVIVEPLPTPVRTAMTGMPSIGTSVYTGPGKTVIPETRESTSPPCSGPLNVQGCASPAPLPTAEPTLAFAQPTVSTPTTTPPVAAITTPAAHLYVAFITPRDVVLSAGDVINFEVQAFDLSGNRLRDITVRWAAQGGVMQSAGVYEAGKDAGVFAIFATVIYKDQKLPVVTTVVIQ